MEALSIGCRNKYWSLIILLNFDFIDWLSLNMPGHCGAGCSGLKSSLYHNGRAYWEITSQWNQNSLKWSVISHPWLVKLSTSNTSPIGTVDGTEKLCYPKRRASLASHLQHFFCTSAVCWLIGQNVNKKLTNTDRNF